MWDDVYFTPIYIPNLVFFINLLIEKKSKGIFNISSNTKVSKFKFGVMLFKNIFDTNNIYPNNLNRTKFVRRPNNMALSNLKIKKKFYKYRNKLKLSYQINSFAKDYKLINEL